MRLQYMDYTQKFVIELDRFDEKHGDTCSENI